MKVLLSSELDAKEKKQILQDDYSIAMTKNIENEVTEVCNLSRGVEKRGISKGITIGRTEGITIGRSEGRIQAMVIMYQDIDGKRRMYCRNRNGYSEDF